MWVFVYSEFHALSSICNVVVFINCPRRNPTYISLSSTTINDRGAIVRITNEADGSQPKYRRFSPIVDPNACGCFSKARSIPHHRCLTSLSLPAARETPQDVHFLPSTTTGWGTIVRITNKSSRRQPAVMQTMITNC